MGKSSCFFPSQLRHLIVCPMRIKHMHLLKTVWSEPLSPGVLCRLAFLHYAHISGPRALPPHLPQRRFTYETWRWRAAWRGQSPCWESLGQTPSPPQQQAKAGVTGHLTKKLVPTRMMPVRGTGWVRGMRGRGAGVEPSLTHALGSCSVSKEERAEASIIRLV